ncbi:glucokinase [Sulfuricella denitrificans skB26]|uniref:Glucokinase n=1 Tax=Sulfuricella denitrificans (strain DSM 22764 / NBRC 105220 / skB26) TaxID=1163617 RepID=S6B385_SULDS|nr:glucokinase [Sulfuricella denitrificans]BAN35117.1 glucokinase [Sulfuricella denitrificans skB26]
MNTSIKKTLLAGDIGGTKTLLQIFESGGGVLAERRFDSASYASLNQIIAGLLSDFPSLPLAAACFGVAGPVEGGKSNITNLPWQIDEASIAMEFKIPQVRLINDFQAVAYGIEALECQDLATLQAGAPHASGVRAVIGAGTGLGEGFMVWQEGYYEAFPSEGSHADFAPVDALQIELLLYLAARFGHVSYERLVSGPGLVNIFEFLRDSRGQQATVELQAAMKAGDPAAAISDCAMGGKDDLAVAALDLFARIYGAEAGNLALKVLAHGGVYIAGGIAPQIMGKLEDGTFLRAFADKGRFAGLLGDIPVHVVLNPKVGLMGAARVAERIMG